MSNSVMLLTYRGRRSGRAFTTPISYVRDGEDLLAVAFRDHAWWRNLRGGAPDRSGERAGQVRRPHGGELPVSPRGKPGVEERRLWLLWVLANAVGEAAGLGLTALVGAVAITSLGEGSGALATLGMAALAVAAGTLVEGTAVGTAQWLVLRRALPRMP
jgi:hypothetical protein